MLEHGGRLRQAAHKHAIPLSDWLDLSTGINPNGWPVPGLPGECWQRLPEEDDALLPAAQAYYQNASLLPVAGSQAAIQTLPCLKPAGRVGVFHPAYAEHATNWQKAGHQLHEVDQGNIESQIDRLDVLIVINPNNPGGQLWQPAQLLEWHARLSRRGGWLVVDEAFVDSRPEYSLSGIPVQPGLIILRSLGKFFGLAGLRCGFVIAEPLLLLRLAEQLGPWTVSHPARHVAAKALTDTAWQQQTANTLIRQSRRLRQILCDAGWPPTGGCHLFQWLQCEQAEHLHEYLAKQAILTRLFHRPAGIRFGLPADEPACQRLAQALAHPRVKSMNPGVIMT